MKKIFNLVVCILTICYSVPSFSKDEMKYMGVEIEQTTIDEIKIIFGQPMYYYDEYSGKYCYSDKKGDVVVFGFINSSRHDGVNSIYQTMVDVNNSPSCGIYKGVFQPLAGLQLGMLPETAIATIRKLGYERNEKRRLIRDSYYLSTYGGKDILYFSKYKTIKLNDLPSKLKKLSPDDGMSNDLNVIEERTIGQS